MNSHEPGGATPPEENPPIIRNDADFRTAIHSAVRNGLQSVTMRTVPREEVRAVADRVLSLIAVAENASSAARPHVIPADTVDTASIRSVSLEREGVGLGSIAVTPAVDVDALQSLAREASPGPWEVNEGDQEITLDKGTALTRWNEAGTVGYPARSWNSIDRLAEIDPEDYTEDEVEQVVADMQYIAAARPEVMLALIERLRRAETQIADAVAAERARAAAHAREGYRASENCDDIAKRILSGEPAIGEGDQP